MSTRSEVEDLQRRLALEQRERREAERVAEDALRRLDAASAEVERRAGERTAELARANRALERSVLELQKFAYVASHDLQTPLRAISGFVQLIERTYRDRLDEQANHWIERVVEGTEQMSALIQDLLVYTRVDSRARPFEPVDLGEVLDEAVESLEASVRDAGAQVTRDDLPRVSGDRRQLTQLFQSLLENAIKYGGPEPPEIHVSAQSAEREWIVSVRDSGIGVEPRHRERIFEIFRRLHSPHEYPGTGIGLALCRRVVERHGGRIWVEAAPSGGSVFRFTLPEKAEGGG